MMPITEQPTTTITVRKATPPQKKENTADGAEDVEAIAGVTIAVICIVAINIVGKVFNLRADL